MVEDVITELSRFQRLFVIARNTSFTCKGRSVDVKKVASEPGVHFVLEGSVRKAGWHVWAERYEDVLSDVFEPRHARLFCLDAGSSRRHRGRTKRRGDAV